jgi:hypothetical protein
MVGVGTEVADARGVVVFTGVIARIVAATIVSTALGTTVGKVDPKHAIVTIKNTRPAAPSCFVLIIHFS